MVMRIGCSRNTLQKLKEKGIKQKIRTESSNENENILDKKCRTMS